MTARFSRLWKQTGPNMDLSRGRKPRLLPMSDADRFFFEERRRRLEEAQEERKSLVEPQAPAGPSGPLATAPQGATAVRPCGPAGPVSVCDGDRAPACDRQAARANARPQAPGAERRDSAEDVRADARAKPQGLTP